MLPAARRSFGSQCSFHALERDCDRQASAHVISLTYASAAAFALLIIAFSVAPAAALLLAVLGVVAHLALFPLAALLPATLWLRVTGLAWLSLDVILNVSSLNGLSDGSATPFRLGGHVLGAVWIAGLARSRTGLVAPVGLLLAALLGSYSFAAPWVPAWVLFLPFVAIPIWLVLLARSLRTSPSAAASAALGV